MKTFFKKHYNSIHWVTVAIIFLAAYIFDKNPDFKYMCLVVAIVAAVINLANNIVDMISPDSANHNA